MSSPDRKVSCFCLMSQSVSILAFSPGLGMFFFDFFLLAGGFLSVLRAYHLACRSMTRLNKNGAILMHKYGNIYTHAHTHTHIL